MKQDLELLISKVELSDGHLYLHTRNLQGYDCLWTQLWGQSFDVTEGRKPILYYISEDTPESLVLDVESNLDQLILLLEYLEIEMKSDAFLPVGTTDDIRKQIAAGQKSNKIYAFFDTSTKPDTQEEVEQLPDDDTLDEKKPIFK